ncbi:hypothetical protein B1790_00940 [Mycobacterium sp. AT1]|nr:hypothetical protein B1790_00940 [Mycobacterium sp. AT1]
MTNATVSPMPGRCPTPQLDFDLDLVGYSEAEFALTGEAESFALEGERTFDGQWNARVADSASFVTRVIVRRPSDLQRWSGRAVVEWLNVSGGRDLHPDWTFMHRQIIRNGDVWVGVSAQKVGIDGGGIVDGPNLKKADPQRYAALLHPGDAWSFDIFSHAGRVLRSGEVPGIPAPTLLIATGHSQSSAFLSSYINAVDPIAAVFDGYLVHGWAGAGPRLDGYFVGGKGTDHDVARRNLVANPALIRSDARVPVLLLQSETDVDLTPPERTSEPDRDRLRVWEVPGTAHGDSYLFGGDRDSGLLTPPQLADLFTSTLELGTRPINTSPAHRYVAAAALEHLTKWAAGEPPAPRAPRITRPFVDDEHGMARGGIRTPWVDVPTAALTGRGNGPFGGATPFDDDTLRRLYPGGSRDYLDAFTKALDRTIDAGFLLADDRREILGVAAAALPGSMID